ncbi:PIN domain-containing protein [Methylomagnum sp.]
MLYLVDTNIISELARPAPNPDVVRWAGSVERHGISVVSLEEIWFGIARRPSVRLHVWLKGYLGRHEIFPVTEAIAQQAGELRGGFSKRGIARSQADMLIAATAKIHGLTLVTRNVRDFEGCEIGLLNPFAAPP